MIDLLNQTTLRVCERCGNPKGGDACKSCLMTTLHEEGCQLRGSALLGSVDRIECTCANPVSLISRPRKHLWYGPIGHTSGSVEAAAPPPPTTVTHCEARLLDSADAEGRAWIVPAQLAMARRLRDRGLLTIDSETRSHALRGATERRVTRCRGVEFDVGRR